MEALFNQFLLITSLILLASIFLSKSSIRFGLPILILFLFLGMLAGSEGIGGIHFENYELTHVLSLIAICIIIFNGAVETKIEDIKPVLKEGTLLSTLGVLSTALIVGLFTYSITKLSLEQSLLVGTTLSATDAAAVFAAFKDKKAQVRKRLKSLLVFESGSNDPMAYFLVTLLVGYIDLGNEQLTHSLSLLVINPVVGALAGWLMAKIFITVNNRINLDYLGLYPALTLACLFLCYSATTMLNGNGFLSVYIFGVLAGNQRILHKNVLYTFYDGLSWIAQIGLFVMLGLLVFPSRLLNISPKAIFIALFLIFIARPLVISIFLIGKKFSFNEKLFISWAGLKGATPIVFACFVASHFGQKANTLFDIVFFVVLASALIQGSSLRWVAKKLHLIIETVEDPNFPIDIDLIEKTKNGIIQYTISEKDYAHNQRIIDLHLPKGTKVLFLKRSDQFIIPDGGTILLGGDNALVVTDNKSDIPLAIDQLKVKQVVKEPLEI